MGSENFYKEMPSFPEFNGCFDRNNYKPCPADWAMVLTDIRGSTKAIQDGRYQDINMAGAAGIATVLNATESGQIPFVFGGDGATFLIPPNLIEEIKPQLYALRKYVQDQFKVEMRVGLVPIQAILEKGFQVMVAKLHLSGSNFMAMFSGGGLQVAEALVKNDSNGKYLLDRDSDSLPNLSGLSCRWKPLDSRRGIILSLLIQSKNPQETEEIYKQISREIHEITNGKFAPASKESFKYKWLPRQLIFESSFSKKGGFAFFRNALKILMITTLMKFVFALKIPLGPFQPSRYIDETLKNADYRKFDDVLRMIIDVSLDQAKQIEALLQSHYKQELILYGLHRSKQALMTCFVQSASENQHVHFIDGTDGGYAAAAVGLKEQLKKPKPRL